MHRLINDIRGGICLQKYVINSFLKVTEFCEAKQTLTHASEKTHTYIRSDMLYKGKEPKHAKKAQECDDTNMLALC